MQFLEQATAATKLDVINNEFGTSKTNSLLLFIRPALARQQTFNLTTRYEKMFHCNNMIIKQKVAAREDQVLIQHLGNKDLRKNLLGRAFEFGATTGVD